MNEIKPSQSIGIRKSLVDGPEKYPVKQNILVTLCQSVAL